MKASIRTFIDNILFTPKPLPENTYQGNFPLPDGTNCRLHLRINDKGEGILILNASTILHLNSSATEYAYHLIQQTDEGTIIKELVARYQVSASSVQSDYETFKSRLETLLLSPDLDPENFLDIDRTELHKDRFSSPLRLDCALTYQISSGSSPAATPEDRVKRLLDSQEWKTILQKAWDKGIPHVVFTGGEPTLRPDLAELIKFAEEIGQVTGLLTDGARLTETDYLHNLLSSGLDHIMIVLDPGNPVSWEAIKDVINEDISLTVHITVSDTQPVNYQDLFEKLQGLQVKKISLSADSLASSSLLSEVSRKALDYGFSLIWDLPVPYSDANPIALELIQTENSLKGAGRSWLYVEPDGDVLPGQGIATVLGNILTDPWETIWSTAKIWQHES